MHPVDLVTGSVSAQDASDKSWFGKGIRTQLFPIINTTRISNTMRKNRPSRLLVDSHLDIGWNALQWNRDLTRSAYTIRELEAGVPGKGRGEGTVALPELKRAGVGVAFVTTLARCTGEPVPHLDFLHPAQAFGVARGQMAYYVALERTGAGRVLRTPFQLDRYLSDWSAWRGGDDDLDYPGLGLALGMESADPILSPEELDEWVAAGVWMIGPGHYGLGRYCGGTFSDHGFTRTGHELLDRMGRLGVTLDVTHLSDTAFSEAMGQFHGAVVASHSNCRHLVAHGRQLDDAQIRGLIERDGVIGVAMDAWMLTPDWIREVSNNSDVSLGNVADHIDHICQLAGNTQHVGIGSDLDGGFGHSQSPRDVETIADIGSLADRLAVLGYSAADIDAIFHGNWIRKLRAGLVTISLLKPGLSSAEQPQVKQNGKHGDCYAPQISPPV